MAVCQVAHDWLTNRVVLPGSSSRCSARQSKLRCKDLRDSGIAKFTEVRLRAGVVPGSSWLGLLSAVLQCQYNVTAGFRSVCSDHVLP